MGLFGSVGQKTSNNQTTINNDNRVDARQTDNKIAAENSSVIASGGGALSIVNQGLQASDAFEGFQGIIKSFLGQNAAENDAAREASRAQLDTVAGAFRSASSAGAEATAAVAQAGAMSGASKNKLLIYGGVAVLAVAIVVMVARRKG